MVTNVNFYQEKGEVVKKKRISRNIFALGTSSFFNDISSEMILPILPAFITMLGGGTFVIGLIGGMRKLIANLITVWSGYWSDKIGKRRIFIFHGYTISSLSKFALAFSKKWIHAVFFAGVERIGKGLRISATEAMIAESAPKYKGLGFGIHRALDTTGAIVGTLLVLILLQTYHCSFQTIIIYASIIGFISLIPLTTVKEKKQRSKSTEPFYKSFNKLSRNIKCFILTAGIFALAHFSYMFFLIKVSKFTPGDKVTPVLLYLIYNFVYAVGAIPLGMLTDKIGRRRVIVVGYLAFALTSIGFFYAQSLEAFAGLFALYGAARSLFEGNQRAFVADLAPARYKATSLGAFHTLTGILALTGNVVAGIIAKYISLNGVFIWGASVSFIAALFFLATRRKL
jgi:MFS family permease